MSLLDALTFGRCSNAILADPISARLDGVGETVAAYALRQLIADASAVGRRLRDAARRPSPSSPTFAAASKRQWSGTVACHHDRSCRRWGGAACTGARSIGPQRGSGLEGRCLSYGEGIPYWPLRGILLNAFGAEDTVERILEALGGGSEADSIAATLSSAVGLAQGEATRGLRSSRPSAVSSRRSRATGRCCSSSRICTGPRRRSSTWSSTWPQPCARHPSCFSVLPGRSSSISGRVGGGGIPTRARSHSSALGPGIERASGPPRAKLDADLRARIVSAEGEPLDRRANARARVEHGGELDVPPSIQAVLSERIDRLDPGERAFVEVAAVVGLEFSIEAAVELLGRLPRGRFPGRPSLPSPARLRPAARVPAVSRRLSVLPRLVREGVYGNLNSTGRAPRPVSLRGLLPRRRARTRSSDTTSSRRTGMRTSSGGSTPTHGPMPTWLPTGSGRRRAERFHVGISSLVDGSSRGRSRSLRRATHGGSSSSFRTGGRWSRPCSHHCSAAGSDQWRPVRHRGRTSRS